MSTPKNANDNSLSYISSPINNPLSDTGNDFSRNKPIDGATHVNNETVQAPEDLNDFVADLLEQMVCSS